MERLSLCLGTMIWFLVIFCASARTGNETDKLSLLEFKAKIDDDPLGTLTSWNESVHFCSWQGVKCSQRHQRVIGLVLGSRQLKGRLTPHIGNMSFLRFINLEGNGFSHEIPQEIGRLFRLRFLAMSDNTLSGEIPANITACSGLEFLNLYNNSLSGRLPMDIGKLSELGLLNFRRNMNLAGNIPDSIGNLSSLEQLYLSECSLQGNIPPSLGQLKSLNTLVLSENNLTGRIPLSVYNISSMGYFSLYFNKLEGPLPPNLGLTMPNLQVFNIAGNNFSGMVPPSISNASNLFNFQITINNFTGKVPSFANHLDLTRLSMSKNNMGSAENGDLNFLRDLVNCTKLEVLGFSYNNLGGEIPEAISNMTSSMLRRLELGYNQITGELPTGIGNLVSLDGIGLEENHLTGSVPSTIGKLIKLNFLSFHTNRLSGKIPSTLGNLTLLSALSFETNSIQGMIPPSLGECRNLEYLSLAENNLSGSIPATIFSLSSLTRRLDLSRNQLTGSIPIEVGNLVRLGILDISENRLVGEIPKAIGRCINMEYLYLQGNFLQGSIPEAVNRLRGLQVIDLSRNNLSGQVPLYFEDFRGLQFLNLSFNEFEGQVPLLGVFKNASQFSVVGNERLCGGLTELKLAKCSLNSYERKKLIIIVVCGVAGLMVLIISLMVIFRSRKQSTPTMEPSVGVSLPRVSYEDLSKATDNFSSQNLIGTGSFGSVYKGILNQEERHVAVKIMNLEISRALKSFAAECESLGRIRHRNIVKLVTVCSSTDFQGNDFKALVYEFMENGNLEEWLHSDRRNQERSRGLNLLQRIDIAIDVASALDYLHNHCSESIAHCDIKPSNILLDGQMVAHVGDFGLAKLLRIAFSSSSSSNQTSSVVVRGTVGYVAPEYATGNEVSTYGDIYSYGILLLEMVTGKRPTDSIFKDDFNLNNFASVASHEHINDIVDPILLEEAEGTGNGIHSSDDRAQVPRKCLMSIIKIGVACSSRFPGDRRNMGDVAAELRQIRDMLNRCRATKNPGV